MSDHDKLLKAFKVVENFPWWIDFSLRPEILKQWRIKLKYTLMGRDECIGCGYFNEGIMEELCSHPLETLREEYPKCFIDESNFHVNADGYWVIKDE